MKLKYSSSQSPVKATVSATSSSVSVNTSKVSETDISDSPGGDHFVDMSCKAKRLHREDDHSLVNTRSFSFLTKTNQMKVYNSLLYYNKTTD